MPTTTLFAIEADDSSHWPDSLSRPVRRLMEYWNMLRSRRGDVPERNEIDPAQLQDVLPWIFIVEVLPENPTDYRFQIVGTKIVEIEGEYTGQRLSDLFADRDGNARLWKQYDDACAGTIHIRQDDLGWRNKNHIEYEVVLLPLRGVSGEAAFLIGAAYAPLTLN